MKNNLAALLVTLALFLLVFAIAFLASLASGVEFKPNESSEMSELTAQILGTSLLAAIGIGFFNFGYALINIYTYLVDELNKRDLKND